MVIILLYMASYLAYRRLATALLPMKQNRLRSIIWEGIINVAVI